MNDKIHMNGFVVEVQRKRVKNVNLRVYPQQGRVVVSCPNRLPRYAVERFLNQKSSWITKKLNAPVREPSTGSSEIADGSDIWLWGLNRRLSVVESTYRHSVDSVSENSVKVLTKYPDSSSKLQQAVDELYRTEIKRELPNMIRAWESKMGVQVAEFGVKKMKTRWGTCNTRAKRVWLNLHLAKWPVECLEFVVVHEMVHLLERNHSERFYRLMDSFLPDWREHDSTLKTFFRAKAF